MSAQQLLDQILPILHSVKDDEKKLQQILDFLMAEIYEEPDETVEIPEKYQQTLHDIAEYIDCGLVCFLNPETLELEYIHPNEFDSYDRFEEDEENEEEEPDSAFKHDSWEKCITVEPRESHESFKIMEYFVDEVEDKQLQNRLVHALNNRHPFASFKALVESSKYRKQWFDFKQKELEELVWNEISWQFNDNTEA
jgi:hypothetical protein